MIVMIVIVPESLSEAVGVCWHMEREESCSEKGRVAPGEGTRNTPSLERWAE